MTGTDSLISRIILHTRTPTLCSSRCVLAEGPAEEESAARASMASRSRDRVLKRSVNVEVLSKDWRA